MESKGVPTPAPRVYHEFEPSMEWVPEDDSDTLLVYLPGFAKEQLRVQLRGRNLIISGERKLQQNTWSRFRQEFPVSANCDLNKISAKFEGNILYVRQPKVITATPKPEEEKPTTIVAPMPTSQKPVNESNEGPKTTEHKTTQTTQPNTENKQTAKNQDVSKTSVEEKKEKTEAEANKSKTDAKGASENTLEKNTNDPDNKNKKVVAYGELDKTSKKALENYKRAVGVFATKLKTSRNAVTAIVVLLVGLVVGIYVSNSIKSWAKA
ncbi:inactive protein restricted TEV movement 2-like protein [Tanacetum coccineum]